MNIFLILGIMGGVLILASWLYETYEGVKRHKALIDLKFAGVYLVGIVLLIAYSLYLQDLVFIALNTGIAVVVLAEIIYTIGIKKVHKH